MKIDVKKLGSSRVQATVVLEDARVLELTEKATKELGQNVRIKGFRPGMAPASLLKEHIPEQKLQERVIQEEMPVIMHEILETHKVKPIIRPRVELNALSPMTLIITLIEKPAVKVASRKIKLPKPSVEKKETKGNEEKESPPKTPEEIKREEDSLLLESIAEHTSVELADELIDDEAQAIIESHAQKLSQFGIHFEDWLNGQKKSIVDLMREMRPDAEKRLRIRFGVSKLIEEWKIEITDAEMEHAVEELLKPLKDMNHEELKSLYRKGEPAYEELSGRKRVEKLLMQLRG